MEQLWAWLKAITALVIILGFLETILPESAGLRGTAKLVFGIVLMAAVLQPVLELVHLDWARSLSSGSALESVYSTSFYAYDDWESTAARLQAKGAAPVLRAVDDSAGRQLEALIMTVQGVEQARVKLVSEQGVIEAVDVTVTGDGITGHKIQRIIAQYLDLPEERVAVNIEAGGAEP
ncbi:MAG: stage III sporulation protein AF [Firmicutes bacterium]|nr:stage III sporulation protein AF [Bacillota bacterium]